MTDFQLGIDKLSFNVSGGSFGGSPFDSLEDVLAIAEDIDTNGLGGNDAVLISFASGASVTVAGVLKSQLDSDDFVFWS